MKNHITTIILLLLAAVAFALRFFVKAGLQLYCDIAAFALPTVAAIVEIVVTERSSKETEKQIKNLKDNQLTVHVEGETLCFEQGENK
jgi:membrane protein YdbS with pleckstrin-like domain